MSKIYYLKGIVKSNAFLLMKKIKYLSIILFCFAQTTYSQEVSAKFYSLIDSSRNYLYNAKINKSLIIQKELKVIVNETHIDSLKIDYKEHVALYYFLQGDYEQSANELVESLEFAKEKGFFTRYFNLKNNLGLIFSKLGEYGKVKKIYSEILEETKKDSISQNYLSTYANLASAYQNLNKLDSASIVIHKALLKTKKHNYKKLSAALLKFLAKNEYLRKNFLNVIDIVNEIEKEYWDILQISMRDDAIFYRAQSLYHLSYFKQAEKDLSYVFELMENQKNDPSMIERLELLSKIKSSQKKYKEALQIQKQILKIRDSLDDVARSAKVLEIEKKYETEKKEKENLLLKQETALKDLTISKKNNIILIGSLSFILIVFVIISNNLIKQRKKSKDLEKSIKRRITLEKQLNSVRENISEDFHDDLGNKLASITVLTDILEKKIDKHPANKIVKQIQEHSDDLYKGTKDFIWSLKSNSDELEELVTYLSDFGEEFFSQLDIDFTINKNIEKNTKLPYYWNRQIILIFKEAMTNVAKHSSAKSCLLSFDYSNDELNIVLQDNGSGVINNSEKQGNGFKNMHKRAEKINSSLTFESNSSGTKVIFLGKLPIISSL